MKLFEIRNNLKIGDRTTITEILGCSRSIVNMVINGDRNADTIMGRKVLDVARGIIESRRQLSISHQSENQKTA